MIRRTGILRSRRIDTNYLNPVPKADHVFPDRVGTRFMLEGLREFFCPEYPDYRAQCIASGRIDEEQSDIKKLMLSFEAAGRNAVTLKALHSLATTIMFQEASGLDPCGEKGLVMISECAGGVSGPVGTTFTERGDTILINTPSPGDVKQWVTGALDPSLRQAVVSGCLQGEDEVRHVSFDIRPGGQLLDGVSITPVESPSRLYSALGAASVSFNNVGVPRKALLPITTPDPASGKEQCNVNDYARTKLCSASFTLGRAKTVLQQIVNTIEERHIAEHQAVQLKVGRLISRMVAVSQAARAAVSERLELKIGQAMYANVIKVAASELLCDYCVALQEFQGIDRASEEETISPVVHKLFPENNAMLKDGIARDFLRSIGNEVFSNPANKTAFWAAEFLPLLLRPRVTKAGVSHLSYLDRLITNRQVMSAYRMHKEMEGAMQMDLDLTDHWTRGCGVMTEQLAEAYIDKYLFLSVKGSLDSADPGTHPVLSAWLSLFGQHVVYNNAVYFLKDYNILPQTLVQLEKEICYYSADLMQDARKFVECM